MGRKGGPLTVGWILAWADVYFTGTRRWPSSESGPVIGAPGETWANVKQALEKGLRGLPRGSLHCLPAEHRGAPCRSKSSRQTVRQVLAWARAYRRRTGTWPAQRSGPIPEAPGETWQGVESALRYGRRGLPGGEGLGRFLNRRLGARTRASLPPLTVEQVLAWADQHHGRTGRWPGAASGPAADAPGENWRAIDTALRKGHRGLPGDSSLSWLLAHHGRGG
jgi:hypothetical protein